jgi:hypothetical protein
MKIPKKSMGRAEQTDKKQIDKQTTTPCSGTIEF